jgi:pimeloyl-ACP methyl ester carboxylesterase
MAWKMWLLVGAAVVLVGFPALLYASAQLSLDRTGNHAAATAALPRLVPGAPDGLARITGPAGEYRARVRGLANSGPGVVFLHGFPETSIMWEPLLDAAAAAGFRAAAFDQRGYSPGARPTDTAAYGLAALRGDVLAIADALGFERFHLVGHDWGSIVGWSLAAEEPERVLSWASLSIPHPGALIEANAADGPPLYIRVFRIPGVVETLFRARNLAVLRRIYGPDVPPRQLDEYLAAFREPGALSAMLDWYRAIPLPAGAVVGPVSQPVLYVFGNRDMPAFVRAEVRALQPRFVEGPLREVELDAGHWLMHEARERVVEEVMAHLEAAR